METSQAKTRWVSRSWALMRDGGERDPGFARHLRDLARPKQVAYVRAMTAYAGEPVGIEFAHPDRPGKWAFVAREMSSTDKPWRIQFFDEDSFSSHTCHASIEEAVEEMIGDGFRVPDPGALARIEHTERWIIGSRRAAILQRHAAGQFDWEECIRRMNQVTAN